MPYPENQPLLSTFEQPGLFEEVDRTITPYVRIDSVAERIYDEPTVDRRHIGDAALKLSLFREHPLFEAASFGPMHL